MILYHGSNMVIDVPDLSKSKPYKDFGKGFYLSADLHDFDIVYGPIADDGVTFQLRRYKAGGLTIKELIQELRYAQGITFQYYFGTELALSTLQRL